MRKVTQPAHATDRNVASMSNQKRQQAAKDTVNKPVGKVTAFPVSGSVWKSYSGDGSPFFSVSFQRIYKNGDGEWQYSDNFFPSDLLLLSEAARMAYHLCEQLRQDERAGTERTA